MHGIASNNALQTTVQSPHRHRASRVALHPFQLELFSSNVSQKQLVDAFQDLGPGAQSYIRSMNQFEASLFMTYKAEHQLLREAVGLDLDFPPKPLAPTLTVQHYKLCGAICAYRLVEELTNMIDDDKPAIIPVSTAPRLPRKISSEAVMMKADKKNLNRLNDIASVVENFSVTINEMSNFRIPKNEVVGPLAHLVTLLKLKRATDSGSIMMNLTVAALHLSYMLETPFQGELPDLPDAAEDYLANLKGQLDQSLVEGKQFHDEAEFLRKIYLEGIEKGKTNLRSPLQLALIISPLLLLMPFQLHLKRWNRKDMTQMATLLGNSRPPALVKAENLVYKTVYRLARREVDIVTAALQLSKGLMEMSQNGQFLDSDVRFWFDLSNPIPQPFAASITDAESLSNTFSGLTNATGSVIGSTAVNTSLRPPSDNPIAPASESPGRLGQDVLQEDAFDQTMDDLFDFNMGQSTDNIQLDIEEEMRGSDNGVESKTTKSQNEEEGENEIGDDEDNDIDGSQGTPKISIWQKLAPNSTLSSLELGKRRRASSEQETMEQFKRYPQRSRKAKQDLSPKKTRPTKRSKLTSAHPASGTVPIEVIEIDYDSETDQQNTEIEKNRLHLLPTPTLIRSEERYNVYGPREQNRISFSPIAHNIADVNYQQNLLKAIQGSYVGGKPLHLVNPDESAFRCLTLTEFESKSVQQVQQIFSRQNILVYDIPRQGLAEFDESCFYTLVPSLDDDIDVQDQSIDPKSGNYNERLKKGTPRQMLDAHRHNGKILNALNFPGTRLTHSDLPLSSDLAAWDLTHSRKMGIDEYPVRNMRWALAAIRGAIHRWHIDSNGFATLVAADNGAKLWIVGYRKKGHSEQSFAGIDFFLPPGFDITDVCDDKWRLEVMVLEPGSRLLMRPNTPHAVFTLDSSICKGGHFYSISTMQETTASLMHSFVTGSVTTNTNHDPSRTLLRKMAELCYVVLVRDKLKDNRRALQHIPCLDNLDGVLNLLSLCNLVIFSNVLDGRTYEDHFGDFKAYDRNGLSFEERELYRHARGLCFQIFFWFAATFDVTIKGSTGEPLPINDVLDYLVFKYLVQQGRALLIYKQKAETHEISGFLGCTVEELRIQLDAVFALNNKLNEMWKLSADEHDDVKYHSLLWSGSRDLMFKEKINAHRPIVDPFSQCGTTYLDRSFIEGNTNGFRKKS